LPGYGRSVDVSCRQLCEVLPELMSLRSRTHVALEGGRDVTGMGIAYRDPGLPYGGF
jgi:hypothetical protein